MVFVCCAREQWPACEHFCHDAPGGPDVDAGVVGARAEEDVGSAVPERHDLVAEGINWDSEGAGKAKIRKLELAVVVDQEILGFEVAVEDAVVVAERYAVQELPHEALDCAGFQRAPSAAVGRLVAVHVLLKVFVHVLEDEHEFVLGVDYVVEGNDVFVFELFHEADFADGCAWCAFFAVEVDLFKRYEGAGLAVAAFEDLKCC